MAVIDISTVHNSLFGICCLEGEERERVKKQWHNRFSERTAFWVDAASGDSSADLVQKLCKEIAGQGISSMSGTPCILTVFLDLTKPLDPNMQGALWQVSDRIRGALNCNVQLVLQFGYVGKLGLSSVAVQRAGLDAVIRANSERAAAIQHRLCLVGSPLLAADGGNNWKAVAVFLDAMRRRSTPTEMLPDGISGAANDDVGFLRYGEFDQKVFDALVKEKETLKQRLGSDGEGALKTALEEKRDQLRQMVVSGFTIDSGIQPQHPQMIVEDTFWKKNRSAAKNGKNREYNMARQETLSAVLQTSKRMCGQIEKMMAPHIADAEKTLQALMEAAVVGVKLKMDKESMASLLAGNKRRENAPADPRLEYRENGSWKEIGEYLLRRRDYVLGQQLAKFDEALNAAYERIYEAGFAKELDELQGRLEKISMRIDSMNTAEQFCEDITFSKDPPESNFQTIGAVGNNLKFFLCRGDKMRQILDKTLSGYSAVRGYEIAEIGGGLQVLDDAPLKAIQVVFLDYNPVAVDELLPEVEV